MIDIITGAIVEANSVSQLFIRQAILNTELQFNGQVWLTRDLAPVSQRIRNQLQNLLFALRTMIRTQPDRLYQDQSVILSLCEQFNLIGWQSGHVVFSTGMKKHFKTGNFQYCYYCFSIPIVVYVSCSM